MKASVTPMYAIEQLLNGRKLSGFENDQSMCGNVQNELPPLYKMSCTWQLAVFDTGVI